MLYQKYIMENKVISFVLFGDAPKYCVGAIKNAQLAPVIYPGWRPIFFLDDSVPRETVDILASLAEVRFMRGYTNETRMVWRFYVAADPSIDRFISRDCDSRLNIREADAVEEWIQSGFPLHTMRDHPHHLCYPILGGMWGSVRGVWDNVINDCDDWWRNHPWVPGHGDMPILNHYVWSKFHDKCMVHHNNFKVKLPGNDFVGEQFDEFDVGRVP